MRPRFPSVGIVVLLLSSTTTQRAQAADDDPWLGPDKALHFGASATIAAGTYALAATQLDARYPALLLGGGVTLAVGAAKEGADALGLGTPSWKDFAWDVAGTVVGLAVAWAIDLAIRGTGPSHPLFGAPYASPSPSR